MAAAGSCTGRQALNGCVDDRADPIRISSSPTVEARSGTLAGKRWMLLLENIGMSESISAAAKAVGLSYKAAWDAVEAMNNLSETALVKRTKGGRGGGATKLTARGHELVATFRKVDAENTRFLKMMNSRIDNLDRDLRIIERLTLLTSARNHFSGKVVRIRKGAVNDEVELMISGGVRLTAIITRESTETLGLKRGEGSDRADQGIVGRRRPRESLEAQSLRSQSVAGRDQAARAGCRECRGRHRARGRQQRGCHS